MIYDASRGLVSPMRIDKLDKLRKSGSITGEEFTRLRAKLVQ